MKIYVYFRIKLNAASKSVLFHNLEFCKASGIPKKILYLKKYIDRGCCNDVLDVCYLCNYYIWKAIDQPSDRIVEGLQKCVRCAGV